MLSLRAQALEPPPRRERAASFAQVIDAWLDAGCPIASPTKTSRHPREKSPNTIANARYLLDGHVRSTIGRLWVDRTAPARLEELFAAIAREGYSTSTVDRTWLYLNQACSWAVRQRLVKTNPAVDVLLPVARPAKARKALTIQQAQALLVDAIPGSSRPAMWLTGLMCGLRPGELAGLRWPFVDIDSENPSIEVAERTLEVGARYAGQAEPKIARGKRRIGLHPLLVAALTRHREDTEMLGLYDPEGFAFCTRNGTPLSLSSLRRGVKSICEEAGLGREWTTYELRHSFVLLVADQLDDLVKVADLGGHLHTKTTQGYRHPVRRSLPHAIEAWDRLLERGAAS